MSGAANDSLVLLLDVPLLMESLPSPGTPQQQQQPCLLEQVLYFVAAYLMVNDSNQLAVYGMTADACDLLHCSPSPATPASPEASNPTKHIRDNLLALIQREQQRQPTAGQNAAGGSQRLLALSAGLSRALCLIHRLHASTAWGASAAVTAARHNRCRPRILCLLSAPDPPSQYVPLMNTIFSAQRAEVTIDTLMFSTVNSTYLQQAAHLTGGLYLQVQDSPAGGATSKAAVGARNGGGWSTVGAGSTPGSTASSTSPRAALQYLLSCMTCDLATRAMLQVHQPLGVDFRAACFCHKTPVDVGHVCSVCLSIYCAYVEECMTCGTRFTAPNT